MVTGNSRTIFPPCSSAVISTTAVARSLCEARCCATAAIRALRASKTATLARTRRVLYKLRWYVFWRSMQINDKTPEIALANEEGKTVSLADYRGKNVVLFFYPRASTSG